LYGAFAKRWRITQRESLFTYEPGKSTSFYTVPGFPYATMASLPAAAAAAAADDCKTAGVIGRRLLADCTFDVGVTGQRGFANVTAHFQRTVATPPAAGSANAMPVTRTTGTGTIVTVTENTPQSYLFRLSTPGQPAVSSYAAGKLRLPAGVVTFEVTNPSTSINSDNFEICAAPLRVLSQEILNLPNTCGPAGGVNTPVLAPKAPNVTFTASITVDFTTPGTYEYLSTVGGAATGHALSGMKGELTITP
jgi:hypothetical protein